MFGSSQVNCSLKLFLEFKAVFTAVRARGRRQPQSPPSSSSPTLQAPGLKLDLKKKYKIEFQFAGLGRWLLGAACWKKRKAKQLGGIRLSWRLHFQLIQFCSTRHCIWAFLETIQSKSFSFYHLVSDQSLFLVSWKHRGFSLYPFLLISFLSFFFLSFSTFFHNWISAFGASRTGMFGGNVYHSQQLKFILCLTYRRKGTRERGWGWQGSLTTLSKESPDSA